jgi:hypothetical protein
MSVTTRDVPALARKAAARRGFLARLRAAIDSYVAGRGRTLMLSRDLRRAQREMDRVARLVGKPPGTDHMPPA